MPNTVKKQFIVERFSETTCCWIHFKDCHSEAYGKGFIQGMKNSESKYRLVRKTEKVICESKTLAKTNVEAPRSGVLSERL